MIYTQFLIAATSLLAANASPYPPEATSAVTPVRNAFFGNEHGNFQPTKTSQTDGFRVAAVGGQVQPPNDVTSINNNDGIGAGSDNYQQYNGDGSTGAGWPAKSSWVSFEDMFNNNKPVMFGSCGQYGQADDSGPEVGAIYDSIQSVATDTKVDHRFILAIMMQESGGCVRVPTSGNGVRNPGLMQDHNGSGTCNENGNVANPCPTETIMQMIREGAAGTDDGDGLAQCINEAGSSDAQAFYRAARIYNSGSVDGSQDLGAGIATHCYASDIANRLTGWVSAGHGCNLDG